MAAATQRSMAVSLYVEFGNPVRALYARLGFGSIDENGVCERMRRPVMLFDDMQFEPVTGLVHDVNV
jgi:hypothetical protein